MGTYEAQTEVPENALFISSSQFWYSKGLTKMKAFRGYFEFYDVLSSADSDEGATRRISMAFTKDDEVSAVQSVAVSQQQPQQQPQQVYDMQEKRRFRRPDRQTALIPAKVIGRHFPGKGK